MIRILQLDANPIAIFAARLDLRIRVANELILGRRVSGTRCTITVSAAVAFAAAIAAGTEATARHAPARHATARHATAWHGRTHAAAGTSGHQAAGPAWHHPWAAHAAGVAIAAAGHPAGHS